MPKNKLSLNTDSIGRKQISFGKQWLGPQGKQMVSAPRKRIRRK